MRQSKVIGLTGGSGSGKSTVAGALRSAGAYIIDCDRVAHENMLKGAVAYGDTDCNGTVALLDVILLNKNLLGMVELSEEGAVNADVDLSGKPDSTDSLYILQSLVSLVTLPVRK